MRNFVPKSNTLRTYSWPCALREFPCASMRSIVTNSPNLLYFVMVGRNRLLHWTRFILALTQMGHVSSLGLCVNRCCSVMCGGNLKTEGTGGPWAPPSSAIAGGPGTSAGVGSASSTSSSPSLPSSGGPAPSSKFPSTGGSGLPSAEAPGGGTAGGAPWAPLSAESPGGGSAGGGSGASSPDPSLSPIPTYKLSMAGFACM